jgi:hypothetical protein
VTQLDEGELRKPFRFNATLRDKVAEKSEVTLCVVFTLGDDSTRWLSGSMGLDERRANQAVGGRPAILYTMPSQAPAAW